MFRSQPERVALCGLAILATASLASADLYTVDFEPSDYSPGTIHLQNGWSSSGSAGAGGPGFDHAVHVNGASAPPSFGDQSLRLSNAVTSGSFGNHTVSPSLLNEAGESGAENSNAAGTMTWSGGARSNYFEASWTFASAVPGAEQVGLHLQVSPDRGDGARMSYVGMQDRPDGLAVFFYDYQDTVPYGMPGDELSVRAGCDGVDDDDAFVLTDVATGLDRTVPHTVRITMSMPDGPRNDVVTVTVDGTYTHVGTSWEDYFRWCEGENGWYDGGYDGNESRTVDSLIFLTRGGAAPGTLGGGFLFDAVGVASGVAATIDVRPNNLTNQINTNAKQLVPIAILGSDALDVLDVDIETVLARGASPSSTKFEYTDENGDGHLDVVLYYRARDMEDPTADECSDPQATLTVEGVLMDGTPVVGSDFVTWQGPSCP